MFVHGIFLADVFFLTKSDIYKSQLLKTGKNKLCGRLLSEMAIFTMY